MYKIFLDRMISRETQLRIVVGVLCLLILYTLLQNIDSFSFFNVSTIQRVCYILANIMVLLYFYKFIRYDLEVRMSFVFIGILVFLNIYIIISLISTSIFEYDLLGNHLVSWGLSILKLLSIVRLSVQLISNKFSKKKIQRFIQFTGIFLLLQMIVPFVFFHVFFDMFEFELIYRWVCVFFDLMPYIMMLYLYIYVLDKPVIVEEEL